LKKIIKRRKEKRHQRKNAIQGKKKALNKKKKISQTTQKKIELPFLEREHKLQREHGKEIGEGREKLSPNKYRVPRMEKRRKEKNIRKKTRKKKTNQFFPNINGGKREEGRVEKRRKRKNFSSFFP